MTGIILAGGKGSRLRKNKALIRIGGRYIIELIAETLGDIFEEMIIVGHLVPEEILSGIRQIEDLVEAGPLGGIYTGLINSRTAYSFVFACDMPFIKPDLVRYMMAECEGYHITLPKTEDGDLHPLHAIYSKECLPLIERQILTQDFKITSLLEMARTRYIVAAEMERIEGVDLSFYNINTSKDLKEAIRISSQLTAYG